MVVSTSPLVARAQPSHAMVNLTIWSWGDMTLSAQQFNRTHPGIHVTFHLFPYTGYYDKLLTALRTHTAPDLAQVEYMFMPTVESSGRLLDMAPYGGAALKNQFVPGAWHQLTIGNAVYGMPEDTAPMAMMYRADLFSKYGIPFPKTWAQFAAAAAKMHAANPNLYITDFPLKDAEAFFPLAWQAGARWFSIQGQSWKVAINDAPTKKVLAYWQDLISRNLVKTEKDFTDAWYADLQHDTLAAWPAPAWGGLAIEQAAPKTSGNWRVAPLPQWAPGQYSTSENGGTATTATLDSKHPKEAAEFAEWFSTDPQSINYLVTKLKIFPANKAGEQLPTVTGPVPFFGNQRIYSVFREAALHVNGSFQWGPTMNQVVTDMQDDFSNAYSHKTSLLKTLDLVQASTVANMKKQGFSVQE
jgi:multiple sugar transport system substrate-binding protein